MKKTKKYYFTINPSHPTNFEQSFLNFLNLYLINYKQLVIDNYFNFFFLKHIFYKLLVMLNKIENEMFIFYAFISVTFHKTEYVLKFILFFYSIKSISQYIHFKLLNKGRF